jgi:hypothetical protein
MLRFVPSSVRMVMLWMDVEAGVTHMHHRMLRLGGLGRDPVKRAFSADLHRYRFYTTS